MAACLQRSCGARKDGGPPRTQFFVLGATPANSTARISRPGSARIVSPPWIAEYPPGKAPRPRRTRARSTRDPATPAFTTSIPGPWRPDHRACASARLFWCASCRGSAWGRDGWGERKSWTQRGKPFGPFRAESRRVWRRVTGSCGNAMIFVAFCARASLRAVLDLHHGRLAFVVHRGPVLLTRAWARPPARAPL